MALSAVWPVIVFCEDALAIADRARFTGVGGPLTSGDVGTGVAEGVGRAIEVGVGLSVGTATGTIGSVTFTVTVAGLLLSRPSFTTSWKVRSPAVAGAINLGW